MKKDEQALALRKKLKVIFASNEMSGAWVGAIEDITLLLESTVAEAYRQGQENGVAWAIGMIDNLHIGTEYSNKTDMLFKGLKNTIRDKYKAETGIDPAPNYPVKVTLQAPADKSDIYLRKDASLPEVLEFMDDKGGAVKDHSDKFIEFRAYPDRFIEFKDTDG